MAFPIFEMFSPNKKGESCKMGPDGMSCRTYTAKKNEKVATGSNYTIITDPKTCKASLGGQFDLNDDDIERVKRSMAIAERTCREGMTNVA